MKEKLITYSRNRTCSRSRTNIPSFETHVVDDLSWARWATYGYNSDFPGIVSKLETSFARWVRFGLKLSRQNKNTCPVLSSHGTNKLYSVFSFQMYPSDPPFTTSVMKDENELTGTIPTEIGLMTSLTTFWIRKFAMNRPATYAAEPFYKFPVMELFLTKRCFAFYLCASWCE